MTSSQPRKQRKALHEGSLHTLRKNLGAHLSKELRKKYKKRSAVVHTGDAVKIMRGKFEGKTGKVERVNTAKCAVFVEGIQMQKANGQKSKVPLHPSNLMITSLNLSDNKRKAMFEPSKTPSVHHTKPLSSEGGVKNE